ncbi:MAG: ribonuclease J [Deltaproteobacteria bacterium]|nr:ribonuclease J [Deltaproteobacteria bacterium]
MNCMALEQGGQVVLVDCGVTFDDRGLGVDVVHPDFSALDTFGEHLVGVVVTHGHEDHIGALPYLLARHDVPVWAPPYALGLIEERLGEHEILSHARLRPTKPRTPFQVGPFQVEPIRVTHSIADATALAIRTSEGVVVHSGDFKLDTAPPDGEHFDEERLSQLGDEGVTLLMSDSTNVDAEGPTGDEVDVGHVLEGLVENAPGAVVVAMFASNVHRLRLLGEIAQRTRRKIVLLGRGVGTHSRVARRVGYLPWPDELVWPEAQIRELPRDRILAIATGSQGEPNAALARLARGEHPALSIGPGDRVILSARTIPGNEPEVHAILGQLIRRGCEVRTRLTDRGVHVSGHAHRPEQRRMIELVRPRAFVPVHGTIHHLTRHAELARSAGVEATCVVENGTSVEIEGGAIAEGAKYTTGRVHVWFGRPIAPTVIREREVLAEEGFASCALTVDRAGKVDDLSLVTRGVVDETTGAADLDAAREAVRKAIGGLDEHALGDDARVAEEARLAIRRTFSKARGKKPMTVVHLRRSP